MSEEPFGTTHVHNSKVPSRMKTSRKELIVGVSIVLGLCVGSYFFGEYMTMALVLIVCLAVFGAVGYLISSIIGAVVVGTWDQFIAPRISGFVKVWRYILWRVLK